MSSLEEMKKQDPWKNEYKLIVPEKKKTIIDNWVQEDFDNKDNSYQATVNPDAYKYVDRWGMPCDAQVIPLGSKGRMLYFLNQQKEFIECRDNELGSPFIRKIFGSQCPELWTMFPKYGKDGEIKTYTSDYDATDAQNKLIRACTLKNDAYGIFNPGRRLRDAGAWIDDDGELIYHYGDHVVKVGNDGETEFQPGEVDGYVYAASEKLNKPAERGCKDWNTIKYFFEDLHTWNWVDSFAPKLLLGWIAESFIGGALDWRGCIWINGDAGTGKSSITEKMLSRLFGDGILTSANYTEAAVRQVVGAKHLPVALDELEAGANYQKQTALIELARAAASGSKAFRGGQDHNATEFELKSCFAFSSINLPPMKPQDRQRIAILNLKKLENIREPDMSPNRLRKVGAIIQRRMLDGWKRLPDLMEVYRHEFEKYTTNARVIKVYGTMLACGDLVLYGDYDVDHAEELVKSICEYVNLVNVEGGTNSSKCVEWLMSYQIKEYQSGKITSVGEIIKKIIDDMGVEEHKEEREQLGRYGIKVVYDTYLFVANTHQALSTIFRDSDWVGVAGSVGGWAGALLNIEGATRSPKPVRCAGGFVGRGVLVPLSALGITGGDVIE
ncbi:MAG: hypothetical protein MJ250_02770 [Alphaproteobacteria bacterium]|nr:hypothetical protein [Alphaproteobacteria bacterium]